MRAGEGFSIFLKLNRTISRPFDFYLLAEAPPSVYTLYLNGNVQSGIKALYNNLPGVQAPLEVVISPSVILPSSLRGISVAFYAVAVEAGKIPPVAGLSDLSSSTQYVAAMDKKTRSLSE